MGLWLRGIVAVEDWAQPLGIGHLPRAEQERAVRARKISLKRKLKRPPL